MHASQIIARKRDGHELSADEIAFFIDGFTRGDIPDYQAAAWLMAVFIRGMSRRETVDLTMSMARSGDVLDLSDILPVSIDKHSSGGVGDKVTLVALPVVAACGVPAAKMSGRGLGFSGGTIDKLESIRGFRTGLSMAEFRAQAKAHGIVLSGQSANLAPADGKLYALRDVTATVPSMPLIASSIMSKKIAAGADGIVLDVKTGRGSFMPELSGAQELARLMVDIGVSVGRRMAALISDMNQPLGAAVGNALEVEEAIACLRGGGPRDLREHCVTVAGHMLRLGRRLGLEAQDECAAEAARTLDNGAAFAKLRELVGAQGGDVRQIDDPALLPKAQYVDDVIVPESGFVESLDALSVGLAAVELGAGRERKGDAIDHAVGLMVHYKVGDYLPEGEPVFTLYANDETHLAQVRQRLESAVLLSPEPVKPLPMFYDLITGDPE
ncbi:MAG: thymidine phosphorylase [Anaerolineae bacterium]|nr:thymidine phosphorylase [Anaerolineae bacterium]